MITKKISLALSTLGAIACLTIPIEANAQSYRRFSRPRTRNRIQLTTPGFGTRRNSGRTRTSTTTNSTGTTTRTVNTQGTRTEVTTSGSGRTVTKTKRTSRKSNFSIKMPSSIKIRF